MAGGTSNRPSRTVIVSRGLWRGWEVTVEPPAASMPFRRFSDHAEAAEWADTFAGQQGWPVEDRTEAGG